MDDHDLSLVGVAAPLPLACRLRWLVLGSRLPVDTFVAKVAVIGVFSLGWVLHWLIK